jgi:uncharacterized membrane protein YjgN (DUF898 family)
MRHSYYGDLRGEFVGTGFEFFKRAWGIWLLAPFAIVLFPLLPFLFAWFRAIEWRWWLSGIRFGAVRFETTLPRDAFTGLYWRVIGGYMLASIAVGIYVGICTGIVGAISGAFDQSAGPDALANSIPLLVLCVIGYLGFILSLNVVIRVFLVRDLWATVLESLHVHNIGATANVAAKGELASALGEGFADGLDVAGF